MMRFLLLALVLAVFVSGCESGRTAYRPDRFSMRDAVRAGYHSFERF